MAFDKFARDALALVEDTLTRTPDVFETLDTVVALFVTDEQGRLLATIPDPAVKKNAMAIEAVQSTSSPVDMFETLEPVAGALWILDNEGRFISAVAGAADVSAVAATVAALQASAVGFEYFESLDTIALFLTDAGNRVLQVIYTADPAAASNTADIATVKARMASVATLDGAPLLNPFGRDFLRKTHMYLTKLKLLGEATQFIWTAGGDSYTASSARYLAPLIELLVAKYGDAGGGWCGFGYLPGAVAGVAPWTAANQPGGNGNGRPSTYPTIWYGNIAGIAFTEPSPDLCSATFSAAGDRIEQAMPATPVHNACDLFFIGTADGQVSYQWGTYNGSGAVNNPANYTFAASTTIAVQGTVGQLQRISIAAGMPAGAGMVRLSWVAGTVKLAGANLTSAAPGVRVNKVAVVGSNIAQWANAPSPHFDNGHAWLGSHLFTYMDGPNSQAKSIQPSTWGGHLATIITRQRAANPGLDILTATPPENQVGSPILMTDYALQARKQAYALRVAYRDMQPDFGDATNPAEYGSDGTFPLFQSDKIHPAVLTGGRLLLAAFADIITPYRGV